MASAPWVLASSGWLFFAQEIMAPNSSPSTMFGLVAVAWGAISSAWGSVLARSLISDYGSKILPSSTTLIGGCALFVIPLLVEPEAAGAMVRMWSWQAIAGWLFLVIFGSLIGYSIYMQLLRDIGPARAGSFAFVSPAIAVRVGALLTGVTLTLSGITGMILMLWRWEGFY